MSFHTFWHTFNWVWALWIRTLEKFTKYNFSWNSSAEKDWDGAKNHHNSTSGRPFCFEGGISKTHSRFDAPVPSVWHFRDPQNRFFVFIAYLFLRAEKHFVVFHVFRNSVFYETTGWFARRDFWLRANQHFSRTCWFARIQKSLRANHPVVSQKTKFLKTWKSAKCFSALKNKY